MRRIGHLGIVICYLFWIMHPLAMRGQSIDTEFGKNRVQFNNDFKYWSNYETEDFVVYWYGDGRYIAQSALQIAVADHDEIRKLIEHKINDKIEIIVYRDQSEQKQSNIGAEAEFQSRSGETKIAGTRMLVYYNGNQQDFRRQVREGIASIYLESIKFGSNIQEFLQNAVLLDLPEWFQRGLVSYAGENWNVQYDDDLRDIIKNKREVKGFKKLSTKYPKIIGHSLWTYIGINYGKSAISDLLYLTRITRDVDQSFKFVLNSSKENVLRDWEKFYHNKYTSEQGNEVVGEKVVLKKKKWVPVSAISVSPDETRLAYVTNELGKIRIIVQDVRSGKNATIFKTGFKNKMQGTEYEMPALAWNAQSNKLTFCFQKKDKIMLRQYDFNLDESSEQVLPDKIVNATSISHIDDRFIAMAVLLDGVNDIIIYDSKIREFVKVSDDFYSDLDVSYVNEGEYKGLLFVSNRKFDHLLPQKPDSTLAIDHFDVFFYDLDTIKKVSDVSKMSKSLSRMTQTSELTERYPQLKGNKLTYLTDASGIINAYMVDLETNESHALTNTNRNILRADNFAYKNQTIFETYLNGNYEIFLKEKSENTKPRLYNLSLGKKDKEIVPSQITKIEILPGHKFQSKFQDDSTPDVLQLKQNASISNFTREGLLNKPINSDTKLLKIDPILVTAAGVKFSLFNIATRFDNEVLFEGLEIFDGQNNGANPLPMGFLAKASITDIFNDYKIEGGIRFPTTFNGSEYFLVFDNNKRKLDKRISLYRRSFMESRNTLLGEEKSKYESLIGMYRVKYPFTIYSSVRATASLRSDKYYLKVTDNNSLNSPVTHEKRLGIRLEYVYDNTFIYDINLLHGTRLKIYMDAINQFNLEITDGFNLDFSKGFTSVIGFDARHYIQVLDHMVFAMRGAGATSFGSKKNIYFLGGVANSLINNFENSTPIPTDQNFALQSNVNQMRGFYSNIRNGSSYLVGNFELRIPVFKYLLGKDKGSSFIRNFQVVAFGDAGLAWFGASPFSDKNPINTVTINGEVIDLEIQYFRDPLVLGYGLGLRTKLLGYFIKFDYARGIETRKVLDGKFYISFGTDF